MPETDLAHADLAHARYRVECWDGAEMRVRNKVQMYRLLTAGAFGNHVAVYPSVETWRPYAHRSALWGIRTLVRGGRFAANVPTEAVPRECLASTGPCCISPMQPDDKIRLQGEVIEYPDLQLYYSRAKTHMRAALARDGRRVRGLTARGILREAMDPSSYSDLCCLLDTYPGHAVEFSVYACHVGVLPCRNTVFWEVRDY